MLQREEQAGIKVCLGCGIARAVEEFNFKNKRLGTRQTRCRICTRLQVRAHYDNNRSYYTAKARKRNQSQNRKQRQLVHEYLASHPCVDCGESDVACLDFDHVRGRKLMPVSSMVGDYDWAVILREIEKCEVRCANCHRRKTARQRGYYKLSC